MPAVTTAKALAGLHLHKRGITMKNKDGKILKIVGSNPNSTTSGCIPNSGAVITADLIAFAITTLRENDEPATTVDRCMKNV